MRRADRMAIEKYGIPSSTLMENAGRGAFEILRKRFPILESLKAVVVCGKGNNGGDGMVVARCLKEIGCDVEIFGPSDFSSLDENRLKKAHLIIDALFGIGLSKEVTGEEREIIEAINQSGKKVVALDVPSGLSADTGRPHGVAVKASLTVTMGLPKIGLVQPAASSYVGDLEVIDIGIPERVYEEIFSESCQLHWLTDHDVRPLFRPREMETHKGTFGHVLFVGGSETKAGAILMSGRAALRSGSGLATVALPDKAFRKFPKRFLELMYEPLPSARNGTLSKNGWGRLKRLLFEKEALAVGPGLGVTADTRWIVERLMKEKERPPMVLDADALNGLASGRQAGAQLIAPLRRMSGPIIMTPHPGEMARLLGTTTAKVQSSRMEIAQKFAQDYGVILVLKGHRTIVACLDGNLYFNSTGNPGMATAGMGDVLTGMIGSFLGQGMTPKDAAVAAVYLHGRAGDRVAERLGDRGLLAMDVVDEIPNTVKEILGL